MKSSRNWEAVVYPDSESYVAAESLAKATQYFGQWCYVLHDKDLNDDGTPKKAHYHVYGKLDTARTPQSVRLHLFASRSSLFSLHLVGEASIFHAPRRPRSFARFFVHLCTFSTQFSTSCVSRVFSATIYCGGWAGFVRFCVRAVLQ